MKMQFIFNGRKYFASNKSEAKKFIDFWHSPFSSIFSLNISWDIKTIEVAPKWVPIPLIENGMIEYEKIKP